MPVDISDWFETFLMEVVESASKDPITSYELPHVQILALPINQIQ